MSVKRISLFTQSKSGDSLTQSKKWRQFNTVKKKWRHSSQKKFTPHAKNNPPLVYKNKFVPDLFLIFTTRPDNMFWEEHLQTFHSSAGNSPTGSAEAALNPPDECRQSERVPMMHECVQSHVPMMRRQNLNHEAIFCICTKILYVLMAQHTEAIVAADVGSLAKLHPTCSDGGKWPTFSAVAYHLKRTSASDGGWRKSGSSACGVVKGTFQTSAGQTCKCRAPLSTYYPHD